MMMHAKKKVYKAKGMFAIIFFLLPALFIAYTDVSCCYAIIMSRLNCVQTDWSVTVAELFVLLSFTGVILFWLLNMCPVRIIESGEKFEFVYLFRNKVKVKKEGIRILQRDIDADGWYAILFLRGRFTFISDADYPQLQHLIE
ncbi:MULTISPECIES: hypothetical protein [unclassified Fibrobacter]|uniref:hypothetical protein n=1 Tax=unclassified Fibrobacter TaxID=2634177 RepID=UPI000D6BB0DC|nr:MULTISPECIES: hypothetical protein [unclassified Fibrobacter]PWJ71686.1 hypothetical protein BGX12_10248 [Fibrobacter sp. UWR4]PZW74089.1 hypothetical protein C8E88_1001112 [Fibrobacter sp. UWR1]